VSLGPPPVIDLVFPPPPFFLVCVLLYSLCGSAYPLVRYPESLLPNPEFCRTQPRWPRAFFFFFFWGVVFFIASVMRSARCAVTLVLPVFFPKNGLNCGPQTTWQLANTNPFSGFPLPPPQFFHKSASQWVSRFFPSQPPFFPSRQSKTVTPSKYHFWGRFKMGQILEAQFRLCVRPRVLIHGVRTTVRRNPDPPTPPFFGVS